MLARLTQRKSNFVLQMFETRNASFRKILATSDFRNKYYYIYSLSYTN